jgi:hypothetical protein
VISTRLKISSSVRDIERLRRESPPRAGEDVSEPSRISHAPTACLHDLRIWPYGEPIALADLYGDPKGWHPDVDDLDIPQEEVASVGAAATILGIELPAPLGRLIEKAAKSFERLD